MIPLRTMLDFDTMFEFYLIGEFVARRKWTEPIDRNSGYTFTEDDKKANDWMTIKVEQSN